MRLADGLPADPVVRCEMKHHKERAPSWDPPPAVAWCFEAMDLTENGVRPAMLCDNCTDTSCCRWFE